MLVVFVFDTTASMNQRSAGFSFLDIAKGFVEQFVRVRQKDVQGRREQPDRYAIVTCQEGPAGIRVSFSDTLQKVFSELKSLEALDLGSLGVALARALEMLNVRRVASGMDTYGFGRTTAKTEPGLVMVLTDGGATATADGAVQDTIRLPRMSYPGVELTLEPFRWDQRVVAMVIRAPPVAGMPVPQLPLPAIAAMCNVTGGRCHAVTSLRGAVQLADSLAASPVPTFIASFEGTPKEGAPPPFLYKQLFARALPGQWPLPETYTPEQALSQIPPRSAQPWLVYHRSVPAPPTVPDWFPVDVFDIEPSPLVDECRAAPRLVHISRGPGSSSSVGPCALLRCTPQGLPQLLVLPLHFPRLLQLLGELPPLLPVPPHAVTSPWRAAFDRYLAALPPYYYAPLRAALRRIGLEKFVPEALPPPVGGAALQYLKTIKAQARAELERRPPAPVGPPRSMGAAAAAGPGAAGPVEVLCRFPAAQAWEAVQAAAARVRGDASADRHALPVAEMGDYRAATARSPEPRDPLAGLRPAVVPFGNPFRPARGSEAEDAATAAADGLALGPEDAAVDAPQRGRGRRRTRSPSPVVLVAQRVKALRTGLALPPASPASAADSVLPLSSPAPAPSVDGVAADHAAAAAVASTNAAPAGPAGGAASEPEPVSAMATGGDTGLAADASTAAPSATSTPAAAVGPAAAASSAKIGLGLRQAIVREIRLTGKTYDSLYALLRGLPDQARLSAIDAAIAEARKWKKSALVDELLRFRSEGEGTG